MNRIKGRNGSTLNTYDAKGNILSYTPVGSFEYDASIKPYAVKRASVSGNPIFEANQVLSFNALGRVSSLRQDEGKSAAFLYNEDGDRMEMVSKDSLKNLTKTDYYIGDTYQYEDTLSGNKRKILYVGGDAYGAPAVYVQTGSGSWKMYYICRDYLGSVTAVTDEAGNVIEENSYDVWGRQRNPVDQTAYAAGSEPSLFLGRGYTGHEYLPLFGLINMNARLYDPALGRFISPDPNVQNPYDSQNFNRYSYALNNPMLYKDQNGELFFISYLVGFLKGLFSGKNPIATGLKAVSNEAKIVGGLFAVNQYNNFGQQVWELASRFTWQFPQTLVGYTFAEVSNSLGQVNDVGYWGGATVISGNNWGQGGAVTMGSFIVGDNTLRADPNNNLFQHEYGHYLQSQEMGWAFLPKVGFPSLINGLSHPKEHDFQPYEQDANRRSFEYLNKHVPGFYQNEAEYNANGGTKGWNFYKNPLDVRHEGNASRFNYYDYRVQSDLDMINRSLSFHAMWYDVVSWLTGSFGGIVSVGLANAIYYENTRLK